MTAALPVIVQARMGSSRLPGKMLRKINGCSILGYVIDRLRCCQHCGPVMVATSVADDDSPLSDACADMGVRCFRGPLKDVASRLLTVAQDQNMDAFIRISGDSPLIDARIVDRAAKMYASGASDVVSNVVRRSFPKGQSVEVIRTAALRNACDKMTKNEDREHVTPYFYRHADDFRIASFTHDDDLSEARLCIDTREDLNRFTAIIATMRRFHTDYNLEELLTLASRHNLDLYSS